MKKVFLLLLTFFFCLSFCFGTEFLWEGEIRTRTANYSYIFTLDDQISLIDTRVKLFTTATFSENLKAVVGLEIGDFEWGNDDHNADYENVETKNAYLEFTPEMINILKFRVGLQSYADPFGSAVFDEDAAGIMVMPELDSFNMNAGIFVLEDDDVVSQSTTFGVMDLSKNINKLFLKGSFYYFQMRNLYSKFYTGIGADYILNDAFKLGGHFLYMGVKQDPDKGDYTAKGYFAYLFGEYTNNKFSAKLNFGYSPADYIADDPLYFSGIIPYPYLYGLEFFFPGDIYDDNAYQMNYGSAPTMGSLGSMVISANLNYDFLFANVGMVNTSNQNNFYEGSLMGTEIDLGIDYQLTEGLNFKAVYAIFMVGDYFDTWGNYDNKSELSTQL